jgi:hypothetical protein
VIRWSINDALEIILKSAIVIYWRYYPDICLEGVRKATKYLGNEYDRFLTHAIDVFIFTLRDEHYHSDNENSVKQYILNDDLCMLPGDISDLTLSERGLRKFDYSPITKHFNPYVNQGSYRHDDDAWYDDFSHRVKPLVTCKKT